MCDCIEKINEKLKQEGRNTKIDQVFFFNWNPAKVIISTSKLDSNIRKGPVIMAAAYCPFCGEKYIEKE